MANVRILIAKPGLDGHDRGAKLVARALRDAGHEVIYTGLRKTPEQILRATIDEDVQYLGLSSLSGAHGHLFPRICDLLRQAGCLDVVVFGGGIIPGPERPALHAAGVAAIFGPGTPMAHIHTFISTAEQRRASDLTSAGVGSGWVWNVPKVGEDDG